MLATRSKELDDTVQNARSYDALMKLRLRKEKEMYFVVDDDQVDGSVEQTDPESI
jgi:flagellar biosynthesis regulator FlbT